MARVIWRSWTFEWGAWECSRLQAYGLDWHNGYLHQPQDDDIWLTANGDAYIPGAPFKQATYFYECPHYARAAFKGFETDTKWAHRFTYNPDLLKYPNTNLMYLPGYWKTDGKRFYPITRPHMFTMVLTRKHNIIDDTDNGEMRDHFVFALRNKSFAYWGRGWDSMDSKYQGEAFNEFDKHLESRRLLAQGVFGLALDTSKTNGFVTEKFWNALAAGCIPVYSGPACIKDMVPKNVFIYADDFKTPHDVIRHCEQMDDSEIAAMRLNGRQFFMADVKHSWEWMFGQMDRTLRLPDHIQKVA